MITFYQCNPELFKKCKKTHCQKECTLTTIKEYAKTDEFGNPIIATIDNLYNKESEEERAKHLGEHFAESYKKGIENE